MDNTTMTMHARTCVLFARPRPASILLADLRAQGQGTTVSIVALEARGFVAMDAPFAGGVSRIAATSYKPTDVVRSQFGRPPV